MITSRFRLGLCAILAGLCVSCGTEDSATSSGAAGSTSTGVTSTTENTGTPAAANKLEGRWFLNISKAQIGKDITVALVEIAPEDSAGEGEDRVKLLDLSPALQGATLESSAIDGNSVHLLFDAEGQKLDFRGTLKGGQLLGNVLFAERETDPASMVRTRAENTQQNATPTDSVGREKLATLVQAGVDFAKLREFPIRNPESPMSLEIYNNLFGDLASQGYDEEATRKMAEEYEEVARRWGPRMVGRAQFNIGFQLASSMFQPQLAVEYLDKAEQTFDDLGLKENWEPLIDFGREQADKSIARNKAVAARKQVDDGEPAEGLKQLRTLAEEYPFDPVILHSVAVASEKAGEKDAAIDRYAALAGLPMMEMNLLRQPGWDRQQERPTAALKRLLGIEADAETDEKLTSVLDEAYTRGIRKIVDSVPAPEGEASGNRVIVAELFTGAQCPPCVAADLATAGLEMTFPHNKLVVLRYHQNIPGADPLANEEGLVRFAWYKGEQLGTPSLYLNGQEFVGERGVGGFVEDASQVLETLRASIDPLRSEETPIKVTGSATAEGTKLNVSAEVQGLSDVGDVHRLVVVLAEEKIEYEAGNGIRSHEMVVRKLFEAPEGVAPRDGELAYSATVDLVELRQNLADVLAAIEKQGRPFDAKPLDFRNLHLVAMVQNSATREILQATVVPVKGEVNLPALDPDKAADTPESNPEKSSLPAGPELKPADNKPETEKPAEKPETSKPEEPSPAEPKKESTADTPAETEKPKPESPAKPEGDKPEADAKPADKADSPAEAGKKPGSTPQEN